MQEAPSFFSLEVPSPPVNPELPQLCRDGKVSSGNTKSQPQDCAGSVCGATAERGWQAVGLCGSGMGSSGCKEYVLVLHHHRPHRETAEVLRFLAVI